jgi:molecular chaperone DnaK (HSP70)
LTIFAHDFSSWFQKRDLGETAVARLRIDPQRSVPNLTALIGPLATVTANHAQLTQSDSPFAFATSADARGEFQVLIPVSNNGGDESNGWSVYGVDQLLGMMFGKLRRDVAAHEHETPASVTGSSQPQFARQARLVVAVPACFDESQVKLVKDAASLCGGWDTQIVHSGQALAAYMAHKHPSFVGRATIVDMVRSIHNSYFERNSLFYPTKFAMFA